MLIIKYVFDMSILQGFEIDSLMEFHDLFDNFTSFLKQSSESQKKNLVTLYVVFHSTFVEKGYFELLVLQKFKIQIDMRIVIGYSSVPNSQKKQTIKCLSGKMITTKKIMKIYMKTNVYSLKQHQLFCY